MSSRTTGKSGLIPKSFDENETKKIQTYIIVISITKLQNSYYWVMAKHRCTNLKLMNIYLI